MLWLPGWASCHYLKKEKEKEKFHSKKFGCAIYIFFLISNVKILLIIKKVPNLVNWGCIMGAQIRNQNYNGQEK